MIKGSFRFPHIRGIALALGVVFAVGWTATPAPAAPFAYVTNGGGGNGPPGDLSQYDAAAGALTPLSPASVSTGNSPTGAALNSPYFVAVSPDGENVYVTAVPFAPTSGTLLQYSAGPNGVLTLKATAPLPPLALPGPMAFNPDGKTLYVTNLGGVGRGVIQYSVGPSGDLALKFPPIVASDTPGRLAVSPDGGSVYVATSGGVLQYSVLADGSLTPKSPPMVPVSQFPFGLAVSPDGQSVYVAEFEEFGVNGLVAQFTVGPDGRLSPKVPSTVPAPRLPSEVAVSPNGRSVYVTDAAPGRPNGSVLQFTVGVGGRLTPMSPASVEAGQGPLGIAIQADGKSVYAANGNTDNVSQYTVEPDGRLSPKSPASVPAGKSPIDIAVGSAPQIPTTVGDCKNGGWKRFGFGSQGRCVVFVFLTRLCEAIERRGHHREFCPPTLPRRT